MKLLTLQSRDALSDQETAVSLNLEDSLHRPRANETADET